MYRAFVENGCVVHDDMQVHREKKRYDKASKNCRIYEIKHSTEVNEKQTLHLRDAEKCQIVEKRFGPISGKFVLYRGKDKFAEGVQYLNVENFLCGLK